MSQVELSSVIPNVPTEARRRGGLASSQVTYTCPHCGRETRGAGPATLHCNACPFKLRKAGPQLTSVEMFAGAGGLALGFSQAGFQHLAVVERDSEACASLKRNAATVPEMRGFPILELDSRQVNYRSWAGKVGVLCAGAPCQPFSQGGKRRGEEDERNMFPEVFRAVREMRPDIIVIENVKGLLRESAAQYFDYILTQLKYAGCAIAPDEKWTEHQARLHRLLNESNDNECQLQYEVTHQLLNAADYGLAQHRERVFIIGFRTDLGVSWQPLQPTHSLDALLYAQWVDGSYWEKHGIEPIDKPARLAKRIERLRNATPPNQQAWRTVRDAICDLPEPVDEVDHLEITNHAGIPGARSYKGHTGSPLDYPAKTLKAGAHGVPGGENMIRRPDGTVRYLTIREMARLQGFPDEFVVQGAWTRAMRQLGNAVPVNLARLVAGRTRAILERAYAPRRSSSTIVL